MTLISPIATKIMNFRAIFFSSIHRTAGKGGEYLFTSCLPLQSLHRHRDISRAITAECSPLHMAKEKKNSLFPSEHPGEIFFR